MIFFFLNSVFVVLIVVLFFVDLVDVLVLRICRVDISCGYELSGFFLVSILLRFCVWICCRRRVDNRLLVLWVCFFDKLSRNGFILFVIIILDRIVFFLSLVLWFLNLVVNLFIWVIWFSSVNLWVFLSVIFSFIVELVVRIGIGVFFFEFCIFFFVVR